MKDMFSSDGEKLTEKAFSHNLLISVVSILMCVVALCSITYAWFTTNVSSGENVIESSRFSLDVTVSDGNGTPISITDNDDGTFTCNFERTGEYTVVLQMTADTTASKGYCEFIIDSMEKKQTTSISKDAAIGVDPFTVTFEVTSENTAVVFVPKWGISATANIANGDKLTVSKVTNNVETIE